MDNYSILFERSRSNGQQEQQSLHRMEEDESSTDDDGYIISSTFNNNNETIKLIDVNEMKCDHHMPEHHHHHRNRRRRRAFRSSKTKKIIKNVLLLICIILFCSMCINLLIQIYDRDTYRTAILPGWERNTTRYIPYYILPNQNTTLIDPVHICGSPNPILLMVIVCSSAVNFETRQAIRETWANTTEFNYPTFQRIHEKLAGEYLDINYKKWRDFVEIDPKSDLKNTSVVENSSQQNFSVKVVFLVGRIQNNETQLRINEESEYNNDMIQESFLDTYNNLTLKTVMMLKWVNNNCIDKVKFLMKCDDDTFVNLPNLIHFLLGGTVPIYDATLKEYDQYTVLARNSLNRLKVTNNLLIGSRFCHTKPIGNASSKWYAPTYMFDDKVYPNYLSGTGYVMSIDAAVKLYNASLSIPLFHLEDVYLTGICAKAAHIAPSNHHLFSYLSYKNPCELKGTLTKHELSASDMRRAYEFVTNTTVYCPKPQKYTKVRRVKNRIKNCS